MHGLILDLEKDYKKLNVVAVRSGDTVKVTQRVKEASKERLQAFEGLVIRVDRANSLTYRITVRKTTSGIGIEKSFLIHSPNVVKVEILRRAKVRRNYLSYMRQRVGKSARLKNIDFDSAAVNEFSQTQAPAEAPVETSLELEEEQSVAEEQESEDGSDSEEAAPAEEANSGDSPTEKSG